MTERIATRRQWCSELVTVQLKTKGGWGRAIPALLDEIAPVSAAVLLERRPPNGVLLKLNCGECEFRGKVRSCDYRPKLGYYAGVDFDPGCQWSVDKFEPKHLLDLCALAGSTVDATPNIRSCCNEAVCPREEIGRIMGAKVPVVERVRHVAREVAQICGGLDGPEMETCFSRLFRLTGECRLFEDFETEYLAARTGRRQEQETDLPLLERVQKVACDAAVLRGTANE